ncbi:MarR family winged helix-turn-helix transcriptional regulator [Hyphomicrobium sp. 99]|uniref:MarR family winged helix-turn-helix transcriptional regulator n=1 Tax=Hyphomicrobium sp. 99 TaxID=1163419 RepID=UPI0005F82049|nr:MarR family transcriptional regulator [Hyphomicrobium sp. 99]
MDKNAPSVGFLLHGCARLLRKRFEQNSQGTGLTLPQWKVLVYLSSNEGINQAGLADLLDVEPITLGRSLDKLQALKLIERRPHPTDRRSWLLHLLPAADEKIQLAKVIGDATRAEAFKGISDADREHLLKTLQRMHENLVKACEAPAAEPKRTSHG